MPRKGFPSMIGEYPITGADVERSAPRIPGIVMIAPMLTTGLDGASMTTSACSIAATTPGPAVALSDPTKAKLWVGIRARWRTHHSWKWIALRSPVSGSVTTTWVSHLSSLAGSSVAPGDQRAHSAAVTSDNGYPARNIWLRTRWVARSRSPRPNQSGWTP